MSGTSSRCPPGQIVAFRARFHYKRKGFVIVRVFKTRQAMLAYGATHMGSLRGLSDSFGLALGWIKQRRINGRWRRTPEHGELLLVRTHLNAEPVVHECGHLALNYARRRHLDPVNEPPAGHFAGIAEETFCYALGGLTTSVMAGLRRHRLVATVKES